MSGLVVEALEPLLSDPDPRVRSNALTGLRALGTDAAAALVRAAMPSRQLPVETREEATRMVLQLEGDSRQAAMAALRRQDYSTGEDAVVAERLRETLRESGDFTGRSLAWAFWHRRDIKVDAATRLAVPGHGVVGGLVGGSILLAAAIWYVQTQSLPTIDSFYFGVIAVGAALGGLTGAALALVAKPAAAYPRAMSAVSSKDLSPRSLPVRCCFWLDGCSSVGPFMSCRPAAGSFFGLRLWPA